MLETVYNRLDTQNTGALSVNVIRDRYYPDGHPDVLRHNKNPDDIFIEFINSLDVYLEYREIHDGRMSLEDFIDFYSFFCFSIDSDEEFTRQITGVW